MMKHRIAAVLVCAVFAAAPGAGAETTGSAELRAVWASTLQPCMNTADEVRGLVATARRAGLNTIIAQVRHRGVTFYESEHEPRAPAIRNKPDFDPLASLLREARDTSGGQARIEVYAWFNVFRLGSMEEPGAAGVVDPMVRYADWVSLTTSETKVEFLDPAIPEVQDLLIKLVDECVSKFPVDGINLDYIRYPEEEAGYHPRAVERFRAWAGDPDAVAAPDNERWNDFRREQVTNFVRRCAVTVWRRRPEAMMTVDATGFGGPPADGDFTKSSPCRQVMQDWAGWAREGWVDAVTRMGYKRESVPEHAKMFRDWADLSERVQLDADGPIVTLGIGGYLNSLEGTLAQYGEARRRGMGTSVFSYWRPLRDSAETGEVGPASPLWGALGDGLFLELATPPRPEWRRNIAVVAGVMTDKDGKTMDSAPVALEGTGKRTRTDGSGFFAFSKVDPGEYELRAPGSVLDGRKVSAKAGEIVMLESAGAGGGGRSSGQGYRSSGSTTRATRWARMAYPRRLGCAASAMSQGLPQMP